MIGVERQRDLEMSRRWSPALSSAATRRYSPAAARALAVDSAVGDRGVRRQLAAGYFVHLEGDDAETVSVVLSGQLIVEAYPTGSWHPAVIGVVGPGQIIGEESLGSDRAARASSVRVLETVRLLVLYRDEVSALLAADGPCRRLFVDMLIDRAMRVQAAALASASLSVDVRVGRWLLHVHDLFTTTLGVAPRIELTQEDLASLVGSRRPTVNKVLRSMRDECRLEYGRGWVRVRVPDELRRWVDARTDRSWTSSNGFAGVSAGEHSLLAPALRMPT